jgi:hypothetical protein
MTSRKTRMRSKKNCWTKMTRNYYYLNNLRTNSWSYLAMKRTKRTRSLVNSKLILYLLLQPQVLS